MIARLRAPVPGASRRERLLGFRRAGVPGRLRHRRRRHRLRAHGARPWRRRLQHLRQAHGDLRGLRHAGGAAHGRRGFVAIFPDVPLLRGRAHLRRQGQGRRRQRGRHRQARRGRRARRARAPQAPVPAFLALEGAAHLPQHAAMVHRHGQADRRGAERPDPPLRAGRALAARSSDRRPVGAAAAGRTASPA